MHTEQIEGGTVRRTGWTTSARQCPVHGADLELTFDETDRSGLRQFRPMFDHDDNRIRWRCDACVGAYTESYFLARTGLDLDALRARLRLRCPACGSKRVDHTCVPECCESHACVDCGGSFDARVELTRPADASRAGPKKSVPLDVAVSGPAAPAIRSGFTREFRRCDKHGTALELVFVRLPMDEEDGGHLQLAWWCDACGRSWTEQCFRHLRRDFVPDARPGATCPSCSSTHLVTTGDDEGGARCTRCGAEMRVWLEPSVP
jgi:DNA-directed RNA polymerase subunit RPC12/RpoP